MEDPNAFLDPHSEIEKRAHHLPHWQQGEVTVFVTWRLADSLPSEKLTQWKAERDHWLQRHPKPWDDDSNLRRIYRERFSTRLDEFLDRGFGSCLLKDPSLANVVAGALRHFDGSRYHLLAHVIMPNHVHAIFRPQDGHRIGEIVKSWKGYSAREINNTLNQKGPIWQDSYWDRLIRSQEHLAQSLAYIRKNPTKANLPPGNFILEEKPQ